MNQEELLASYRPWLRSVAAGMTVPWMAEDLAQEGWIAIWRAMCSHDENRAPLDYWVKSKAIDRMRSVVRDWQAEKRDLRKCAPAGHPAQNPEEGEVSIWDQLRVDLGAVEMAYHNGEINAALSELTSKEREYVVLRFWKGWQKPELTKHFGYEPTGLSRRARIKLAERLAHLAA